MAVVMLALNGLGLGHLIRTTIVSRALASVGERPVIFSEGRYDPAGLSQFPVRLIPSLWGSPDEVRKRVASELQSMAEISLPAVVVEDTHPNPIDLSREIRRVLLVRPTSFEYLARLNERFSSVYSAYLLCDSPDSPTWPYDERETRQLASWSKWQVIGPIYRRPTEDEIREVRERHQISQSQEVCVLTMGGGGVQVHDQKGQDIVRFLRLGLEVADIVQGTGSRVRLLFVKGPYFPKRIPIPPRFEVIQDERYMPALLRIAKGAVIRAGFNTTWECLAAGTPFVSLIGTTYAEPVEQRVNRLSSMGLAPSGIEQFWSDEQWRTRYRENAQKIVATHSGAPEAGGVARLILDRESARSAPTPKTCAVQERRAKRGVPLVIRIDDVVSAEPALCWLLDLLAGRGMRASLEVIPYLAEFDEGFLDGWDPSRALFEVSQHGFAHVPRTGEDGRRCEFSLEGSAPSSEEFDLITRGKREMEAKFPKRFAAGFSPPFDALPRWLPKAWNELGGAFVSCLHTNSVPGAPVPVRRAGVDVWDWSADRALSRDRLVHKLALQLAVDGHAGMVLHPRCLRDQSARLELVTVLNFLRDEVETVSLRDLSLGRVEPGTPPSRGDRLWTALSVKSDERW